MQKRTFILMENAKDVKDEWLKRQMERTYVDNLSLPEAIFLGKLEASHYGNVDFKILEEDQSLQEKVIWRSEDDNPFGCEEVFQEATCGSTDGGLVQFKVPIGMATQTEWVPILASVYYDNEECKRPILDEINYKSHWDGNLYAVNFTEKEREAMQAVMDKMIFYQGRFGTTWREPQEENERI